MKMDGDILIVGGGLVGSAMALAAADAGFSPVLIEREAKGVSTTAGYDGRVSAISAASVRVFEKLGLWERLSADAGPIRGIRVADGDSTAKVHFDSRDIEDGEPFGYMIDNRTIRQVLAEAVAEKPGVSVRHEAEVAAVSIGAVAEVTLSGGETLRAPLLLAADGKRSAIRQMLGITSRTISYEQVAMVCTISHERPHEGIALELFLPSGPLAVLPMTKNRACIVWTETAKNAPYFLKLPEADFLDALHRAMRGYLGEIRLEGGRHSYPLSLVKAERYIAPRAALIGDAAHGIHPIAGQGVNLGYRDVAALTDVLGEARRLGLDHGSEAVLSRYERWRRFDAASMTAVTDGLNRLFSTDALPVRALRRLGLRAFDRSGPLKRFFMLNAMGLTGDLPEMLAA